MSANIDTKDILNGLDSLLFDILDYMSGSADRLNESAKNEYSKNIISSSKLYLASKRNNNREWLFWENKKWYMTNKWKVPNQVWGARTFLQNKKNQVDRAIKTKIQSEKQKELNMAINYAVSNF